MPQGRHQPRIPRPSLFPSNSPTYLLLPLPYPASSAARSTTPLAARTSSRGSPHLPSSTTAGSATMTPSPRPPRLLLAPHPPWPPPHKGHPTPVTSHRCHAPTQRRPVPHLSPLPSPGIAVASDPHYPRRPRAPTCPARRHPRAPCVTLVPLSTSLHGRRRRSRVTSIQARGSPACPRWAQSPAHWPGLFAVLSAPCYLSCFRVTMGAEKGDGGELLPPASCFVGSSGLAPLTASQSAAAAATPTSLHRHHPSINYRGLQSTSPWSFFGAVLGSLSIMLQFTAAKKANAACSSIAWASGSAAIW